MPRSRFAEVRQSMFVQAAPDTVRRQFADLDHHIEANVHPKLTFKVLSQSDAGARYTQEVRLLGLRQRDVFERTVLPGGSIHDRSVEGFNKEIKGTEGFVMPATQHDALVWLSGSAYDVIFDMARSVIHDLAGLASLAEENSSWPYRHDRDLTGFIDGSENPTLLDAPMAALLPEGVPGAAGSVLLLQKWKHSMPKPSRK